MIFLDRCKKNRTLGEPGSVFLLGVGGLSVLNTGGNPNAKVKRRRPAEQVDIRLSKQLGQFVKLS